MTRPLPQVFSYAIFKKSVFGARILWKLEKLERG